MKEQYENLFAHLKEVTEAAQVRQEKERQEEFCNPYMSSMRRNSLKIPRSRENIHSGVPGTCNFIFIVWE